jgi:Rrf2 family protein
MPGAHEVGQNTGVRISARADYAVRATAELAAAAGDKPIKAEQVALAQDIPLKFLLNILSELKHARIVRSQRGAEGGFQLARPAEQITLAEVIRAVEGPLASVHEARPEEVEYRGPASSLREVWVAVRANLRAVLESVTVADLASGSLPGTVKELVSDPDAWAAR